MHKRTILALVLMLTVSFGASAIVFETPSKNVSFMKDGSSFAVAYQGDFILIVVDNLTDYEECMSVYNNWTYYQLLKKFSTKIDEETKSIYIEADELYD